MDSLLIFITQPKTTISCFFLIFEINKVLPL